MRKALSSAILSLVRLIRIMSSSSCLWSGGGGRFCRIVFFVGKTERLSLSALRSLFSRGVVVVVVVVVVAYTFVPFSFTLVQEDVFLTTSFFMFRVLYNPKH